MSLKEVLEHIHRDISPVIIIHGKKGTGKTDFSLYLAEKMLEYGYVELVATNVKTESFPVIDTLGKLRLWLASSTKKKLFVFDEAGVYITARRSMSKANVEILKLAHLLRKYRAKMIFTTVRYKDIDASLKDPEICSAIVEKKAKTIAEITVLTGEPETYILTNIPRTSINFDTYDIAYFDFEREYEVTEDMPDWLKALEIFAREGNYRAICEELGFTNVSSAKHLLRKGIRNALNLIFQSIYNLQFEALAPSSSNLINVNKNLQEVDVVG